MALYPGHETGFLERTPSREPACFSPAKTTLFAGGLIPPQTRSRKTPQALSAYKKSGPRERGPNNAKATLRLWLRQNL
jgi:hypothetical protein